MPTTTSAWTGSTAREHVHACGDGARRRPAIVALTANAMTRAPERCPDAGMDALLGNPEEPAQNRDAISALLGRSIELERRGEAA